MEYRVDLFLWMIGEAAIPLISLAMWYQVSLSDQSVLSPQEVVTYYVAVIIIKMITDSWSGAFMAQDILNGKIVQDLIRPVSVFWRRLANELTEKVLKIAFPLLIIIITLILAPQLISPSALHVTNLLLFLVALALAMMLSFSVDVVLGSLAFWLEDVFQIRRYKVLLESIASGLLIPFAMMPEAAQTFFNFLPFRYIVALPAELLLGRHSFSVAAGLIGLQVVWTAAAWILLQFMWARGLRRYAIPGQ